MKAKTEKPSLPDQYQAMMLAQTQAEADAMFAALVERIIAEGCPADRATEIARNNIGYMTGYHDRETAERVLRLYKTAHPVFGKKRPTARKAFALGQLYGASSKQKKEAN